VREAQARCDAKEFAEWRVFYGLEPWGPERADIGRAIIAQLIFASHGGTKAKVEDFMAYPPEKQPQSVAQQKLVAQAIAAAHQDKTD
jgi:hypothetical protein